MPYLWQLKYNMSGNLIALISYSITNIATTLLIKLTGSIQVKEGGQQRSFFHPFMQTEIMILGEAMCIIPYFLLQRKRAADPNKLPSKITLSILPLTLDLSSSILIFVAFNYLSGSVYSLLTGEFIVFTAIFSKFILKNTISRAQVIGSIITIISAVLAGVGQSFGDQDSEQLYYLFLGIILVTIGMALQALQAIVYERVYGKYDITPLQMVGYQGLIGFVFWTALILAMKELGCPFSQNQCVFSSQGNTHLEDYSSFFSELGANSYLMILNIVFLFAVARFNYDQSTIVATANAITLCIIRIFSNSLVWVIGIVITLIGGDNSEFALESLDLVVNGTKFLALICSTLGLLVYYQLIFKKYLRVAKDQQTNKETMISIGEQQ